MATLLEQMYRGVGLSAPYSAKTKDRFARQAGYTPLDTGGADYYSPATNKKPTAYSTAKPKQSEKKYGLIDGRVKLPSHIENQGLYDLSEKSKFDYFTDAVAKNTVGGIAQAGQGLWQGITGPTGQADRALYDYTWESAYNPQKAGNLQYYLDKKKAAEENTFLDKNTFGYKMLESAGKDMQKATEDMSETSKFFTNVAGAVAQNALVAPLAFINPSLAAGVMATSAAGHSIKQQADRSKTLKEANFRGAVDGLIEYGLGKIGIDSYLDNILGNGNIIANIGKNMLSEGGEEALSYLANYGIDKISGDSDAKFDLKEIGLNTLAGGLVGGALGTSGAVIGKINTAGAETFTYPTENSIQEYKPIIFDPTETLDTQYKGIECKATKVISFDNDIYVSDYVKIKRKRLNYVNTRVNKAAQAVGAKSSYKMPRILVCDVTELPLNTAAVYNPADNTLRLNFAITTKQGVLDLPKTVAGADNHNNVFIHEMIHWRDAQRYIEQHGSIDGYMDAIIRESERHIEKLIESGYNIEEISEYAYLMSRKGRYDEVWTEYRVKQLLERK